MTGQFDNPLTIDDPPSLAQGSLDNELVQRRPDEIRRLLKGVLHGLRHPGGDSAAFVRRDRHGVCNRPLGGGDNIALWWHFVTIESVRLSQLLRIASIS